MELISVLGVQQVMSKKDYKKVLLQFASVLTLVMMLAVLILPTVISAQGSGCKEECNDDCKDHGETVCGCIGCLPTTTGYVTNIFEDSYSLEILICSIFDPYIDIEYEFLTRVDRPPQTLLS